MSILLPSSPVPSDAQPSLVSLGAVVGSPLGGADQRFNRLGDRYQISVTLPSRSFTSGDAMRVYLSRLRRALTQGAILPFLQPGLDVGVPGAPVVSGAGQQGSSLSLRGFRPGYTVREGQFFSIIHGGRRYLHEAAGEVSADATGRLVLPIGPMLRIQPGDAAICEFAQPMIEGFLSGNSVSWTLKGMRTTPAQFTIKEAE
jgi:hypothetical protein